MKGDHIFAAFIKKTIDVFAPFEERSKWRISDASGKSINWYLQKEQYRTMFLHKMEVLGVLASFYTRISTL